MDDDDRGRLERLARQVKRDHAYAVEAGLTALAPKLFEQYNRLAAKLGLDPLPDQTSG